MKIEDKGKVQAFEVMPAEGTLYLAAVRFPGGSWMAGPSSMFRQEVIRMLDNYTGIDAARIYAVTVPLRSLPAA